MKFFNNYQNQPGNPRQTFLLILDSKELQEISYFPETKRLANRRIGTANGNYSPCSTDWKEKPIPGFLKKLCLELNQPKIVNTIAEYRTDKVLQAKATVKGYKVEVKSFNTVARAYIGTVEDPIRDNKPTACTWDRFGKCKNKNRQDCNLKLS